MKISIITINYNNLRGLQMTTESVIAQTYRDFEWIVIDGGSTDGSKALIEQYQEHCVYWCSEPDKGIYNAMNKGIKYASGDYCLFLNSGDWLHDENVLKNVVNELDGTDFITGIEWWMDDSYQHIKTMIPPRKIEKYYMIVSSLSHQCTFIKTKLLKERPYDDSLKITADWDEMFYEIVRNNKTYKSINTVVTNFLIGGISHQSQTINKNEREKILNKYLNHKEQDMISITYFSKKHDKKSIRQMGEVAYTAFANQFHSQQDYMEIFSPYKIDILHGCVFYQKLFVWLCLHGYMRLARFLYKGAEIIKTGLESKSL